MEAWFSSMRICLSSFLLFSVNTGGASAVFLWKLKNAQHATQEWMLQEADTLSPWSETLGSSFLLFLTSSWFCMGEFEIMWVTKEIRQNKPP